jgi:uncharacterized tellurite resistance protein B-like protein
MIASRDFYEAIGYLTYVVVSADAEVETEELKKLGNILLDQFGGADMKTKGIRAISRFEMLASEKTPIEDAYSKCIQLFMDNKSELLQFKPKIYEVLDKIAAADQDVEESEMQWINRFKNDVENIFN